MLKKTLFLLAFLGILLPISVFAGETHFSGEYSLQKNEEVRDDLYVAGKNTSVAGNVFGDLTAAGMSVYVGENIVSEDAFVMGATVNAVGEVKKDLRIVGGKTFFGGTTGKDLAVIAQDIQTFPKSVVGGSFLAAAGRVTLNGEVKGDVKIAAGEVFINDKVGGNATISANRIVLGPYAVITGKLNYASAQKVEMAEGAKVLGETTFKQIEGQPRAEKFLPTLWGTWVLIHFVVLLLSALILHGVFRSISNKFVSTTISHFGWSFVRGFVFAVAVPIAITLVFVTFVGIPFGILGIALYSIFLIIASIYSPIVLGSLVYRLTKMDTKFLVNWKTILLGCALTILLGYIPYFGTLSKLVLLLVSLGGIYQVLFDKFVEVR